MAGSSVFSHGSVILSASSSVNNRHTGEICPSSSITIGVSILRSPPIPGGSNRSRHPWLAEPIHHSIRDHHRSFESIKVGQQLTSANRRQ
ncbi:hypothetical protein ACLOJK_036346 [Asimina triloba]